MADVYVTLADLAKRQKYGGGIDDIIEVLSASNPILQDAPVVEGNLPTGHRTTQRTTLPSGTFRGINEGVDTERSTTKQVDDTCALLEGYSAIDEELVRIAGDRAKFRASEDDAFIAGLSNTAATKIFEGNSNTTPKEFLGLEARYSSLGTYCLSASGSGTDNTSIWIIKWSPLTAHLIFPKGTKGGLESKDLGLIPWEDSNNKHYMAWVTQFIWHLGLTIRDYRYVARVCNIDTSELTSDASAGTDLMDKMLDAYYTVPSQDLGKMAKTFVYCNKTVAKYLHKQAMNKANVNLTLREAAGKVVTHFLEAPIHICDAIGDDESTIS